MNQNFPLIGPWAPSEVRAAGVILRDHNNRILLQLRDINTGTVASGRWGFFGGHVEGDEDTKAAAIREFKEETGITLSHEEVLPFARALSLNGVQLFAYTTKRQISPSEIRLGEGAGFAFMTADQVRNLDLIPAAGLILHHFIDNMDKVP